MKSGVDPTDGAALVWDLKPGDKFRDSKSAKSKIKEAIQRRYMKTGEMVKIITLSEDEIEVSL